MKPAVPSPSSTKAQRTRVRKKVPAPKLSSSAPTVPPTSVHRVYGPPDLDKGKEEAGDAPQPARTPALGEPLDSLQSFLGELASSTPHVAEDQHTVSIKVPVMRETVEAQLDDYGSLLDDELVKLMASVEGEGRGELDAIRYELVTQADVAMRSLLEQMWERFSAEISLVSVRAQPLSTEPFLSQQKDMARRALARAASVQQQQQDLQQEREATQRRERTEHADLLAALRALEEERDVLKKQVDNLRSQARNSRARAASIHEADDAAIKEQVEALRKEVADKDTLLSKLRAEARDARDECKRLMGLLEVNVRTDGAQVEALRVEARDARQMCDAQTALAAKLTRATKELTTSHKLISSELDTIRKENERLEKQLMAASMQVATNSHGSTALLKARVAEVEERRRREVSQLMRQNELYQQMLEDERSKSVSGETMQVMLDDVLHSLEEERREIRRRLGRTQPQQPINASF